MDNSSQGSDIDCWTIVDDADCDCIALSDSDEDCDTFSDALDSMDDDCELSLCDVLAAWVTQFDVPTAAVNSLLRILHAYHAELPLDHRTLVNTPRNTVIKRLHSGGEYVHFGIRHGLEQLLKIRRLDEVTSPLKLQFNVDGLPLFKSSGVCLWPILCLLLPPACNEPFVVGVFCGTTKPNDLNEHFYEFVDEAKQLVDNGLCVDGNDFGVELNSFVCDAPARAMLTNVKSHGGYYMAVISACRKVSGMAK